MYAIPVLFILYLTSSLIREGRIRYYLNQVLERSQIQAASNNLVKLASNATDLNGDSSLEAPLVGISHQAEKDTIQDQNKSEIERVENANTSVFSLLKLWILGLSCNSPKWNGLSLLLHTMLVVFAADFAISPFLFPSVRSGIFIGRAGSIGPNEVKLHIRYPNPLPTFDGFEEMQQSLREGSEELEVDQILGLRDGSIISEEPLRVIYKERNVGTSLDGKRAASNSRWERGPLLRLSEGTDWNAVAKLENLFPSTEYEWRLSFVHNNSFARFPEKPLRFTTWPDPRDGASKLEFDEDGSDSPMDNPNL